MPTSTSPPESRVGGPIAAAFTLSGVPPDEIDAHPAGGNYQRDISEGGGSTSTYPFERWRYRYLEGVGQEVTIEFVDSLHV